MKLRQTIIVIACILGRTIIQAQNLFNPYYNITNLLQGPIYPAGPDYPPTGGVYNATNPNGFYWRPDCSPISSGQYTGEYMIILDQHPWHINPTYKALAKSYSYEVVSFPFTTDCWQLTNGCMSAVNQRIFQMPTSPYINNKWGDLCGYVYRDFDYNYFTSVSDFRSKPADIVSYFFIEPYSNFYNPNFLPHTVLKQTVYLHCDDQPNSAIIDSFSWINDNTRGAMRFYPFKNDNASGAGSELYDVIYRPNLLVDPLHSLTSGYQFNNISNDTWIDGGTLDYFPFSESVTSCGNFNPSSSSSTYFTFYNNSPSTTFDPCTSNYVYHNIFPAHLL